MPRGDVPGFDREFNPVGGRARAGRFSHQAAAPAAMQIESSSSKPRARQNFIAKTLRLCGREGEIPGRDQSWRPMIMAHEPAPDARRHRAPDPLGPDPCHRRRCRQVPPGANSPTTCCRWIHGRHDWPVFCSAKGAACKQVSSSGVRPMTSSCWPARRACWPPRSSACRCSSCGPSAGSPTPPPISTCSVPLVHRRSNCSAMRHPGRATTPAIGTGDQVGGC